MKDALARAFQGIKRAASSFVRGYAAIVWGRSDGAGVTTAKTLIRGGPLSWLGFLVLLASIVVTVYLTLQAEAFPVLRATLWEGEEIAVPAPSLCLSLFFTTFGWAYLLCGTAAVGPLAFLITAAYVAYYGIFPGITLGGTLWFTLPSLWLLALGAWAGGTWPKGRWTRPVLLALSMLVAHTTYGSLGVRAIVPADLGMWGKLALGGIYFAAVANPWVLSKHSLRPGVVFTTTVIILGSFYAGSLAHSPAQEILANTFLAANGLLSLVSLFWYWIGLDLFNGAQDLAEWLVEVIKTVAPRRALATIVFSVWFAWSILARLLTSVPSLAVVELLGACGWGRALLRLPLELPPDFLAALDVDFYITTAIALIALALWATKKLSPEALIWVFGLSLAAFVILWGYFGKFFSFGLEEGASAGLWPLAIYVGAMVWEVFKMSAGLLAARSLPTQAGRFLFLGFLLLLGGISHLELLAEYPQFQRELSLTPFLGILYLGLPYLLYKSLYQQKRYTPVPSKHLLLLFAFGMLSAIPALLLGRLFLAPICWLAIALSTVWRWGKWDEKWDGLTYTLALVLGYVTFYTNPIFIPLPVLAPFLEYLMELQGRYALASIYPWEANWWRILVGALGAGVLLGYPLAGARLVGRRRAVLLALLGLLASTGFLFAYELALGL